MTTKTGSLPAETQITAGHGHPRLRTDKAEVPGSIPGIPTRLFPQITGRFQYRCRHSPEESPSPRGGQKGAKLRPNTHDADIDADSQHFSVDAVASGAPCR